jgi:flavin reductase (DIM6/NTAB) family NADH-FMN oxidoreductase RutF
VTIHSEHPFLPPGAERSPLRRLRARLPLPVTVWTAESAGRRVGWTVSSVMLADGEPAEIVGLVDEDSELADMIQQTRTFALSVLGAPHRQLADAFAGVGPAPGGAFRLSSWTNSDWGPVLADAPGWLGARLLDGEPGHAGWGLLVRAVVEHVEVADEAAGALGYCRGRYRQWEV